jgi:hypothetical protein
MGLRKLAKEDPELFLQQNPTLYVKEEKRYGA